MKDIGRNGRNHGLLLKLIIYNQDTHIAQLDRAPDYESGGWEFESLFGYEIKNAIKMDVGIKPPKSLCTLNEFK